MASTSRSEADAMIEEFIQLQEAQVRLQEDQVRIQEAQLTVLKRMLGSSPAAATSTPTKDAKRDPKEETSPVSGDSMQSRQDATKRMLGSSPAAGTTTPSKDAEGDPEKDSLPVTVDSMRSGQDGRAVLSAVPMEEAGEISTEEEPKAESGYPLHLREWCDQDPFEWMYALRWGDCKSLMSQLRTDPYLMMLTYNGRTVLHVASILGCTPLIHPWWNLDDWQCHDANGSGYNAVYFAVDARTHLTAYDINKFFVGQKYSTSPSRADGHNGQLVQIRADINQLLLDDTNHEVSEWFRHDETRNFDPEHVEFTFHLACRKLPSLDLFNLTRYECERWLHYLKNIIECLTKGGGEKLNCLLQLQDPTGNPPFQLDGEGSYFREEEMSDVEVHGTVDFRISTFKELLLSSPNSSFGIFINAPDTRGWTVLHKCAARGYYQAVERLMKEESIDGNVTLPKSRATPLHLAILHNHPQVVKILLMAKDKVEVNAIFKRYIVYGDKDKNGNERIKNEWTPLQLAAILGYSDVVRELLAKVEQIHDICKKGKYLVHDGNVSALHMAAASGIPEVLRLFLKEGAFNPLALTIDDKRSALHFATDTTTPCMHLGDSEEILSWDTTGRRTFTYGNPILKITDFATLEHHAQAKLNCENDAIDLKSHWRTKEEYGGKMACITMLLQAGIDVWQQDGENNYAEPGSKASSDVRLWWYERVAQETLEAKKNLNDAGNAISVVAALVATASYVGPLQPPLGYASDTTDPINDGLVQATNLMIRVFVVSNCLSFYLAIGSIMFAVVPSLPMPQEGIFEEWQRSRRSVGLAMSFLLLSILGVLVSFAAASNVGMSKYYSWQHKGLAFYPTLVGGIACLFGIIVFMIRLLRLILQKNERIRYVYQKLA